MRLNLLYHVLKADSRWAGYQTQSFDEKAKSYSVGVP